MYCKWIRFYKLVITCGFHLFNKKEAPDFNNLWIALKFIISMTNTEIKYIS